MRTQCDYLKSWIKKKKHTHKKKKAVTYAKISPKMVNLRDLAGNAEEEEEEEEELC